MPARRKLWSEYKDAIVHWFINIIKMNYADFSLEPLPQSLPQFYEAEYLAPSSEQTQASPVSLGPFSHLYALCSFVRMISSKVPLDVTAWASQVFVLPHNGSILPVQ